MRRITLERVINIRGVQLIAVKKVPLFNPGDIIKISTPDGTYHSIFCSADTRAICSGCLFEDIRLKRGILACPTFKDGSFLCTHTQCNKDTHFMPLYRVLEDL